MFHSDINKAIISEIVNNDANKESNFTENLAVNIANIFDPALWPKYYSSKIKDLTFFMAPNKCG